MSVNPVLDSAGVHAIADVLDPALVRALTAAMNAGPKERATFADSTSRSRVDETIRSVFDVSVPGELDREVRAAVAEVAPQLEARFGGDMRTPPTLDYLRYEPGGHYIAHRDRPRENDPSFQHSSGTRRRVSIVLFVNSQSDDEHGPETYRGGSLLFRAFEGEWSDRGFGLSQTTGTLVAFPSTLVHEVTPVLTGVRHTAVGWFE